jgi:hypothetical protein
MKRLLTHIILFEMNIEDGKLEAAQASKRLIDKQAAEVELKVWRTASRIIMEGY